MMKLILVSVALFSASNSVVALQGNSYLSQLGAGGGGSTTSIAPSGPELGHPSYKPSTASFFPVPSSTVGSGGNGMADLYSAGSPASATPPMASVPPTSHELLRELWGGQVSVELAASQLYLSASIWFRSRNMPGMAAWMLEESAEERGHGLAILEFAMRRGGEFLPVALRPLDAPRNDWDTPSQVWRSILEAEQTNTRNLLRLAAVADGCGDHAATAFLGPFHLEQLEAEDKVGTILGRVEMATPQLMAQLDYDLGKQAEEEEEH
jgi:ferritin